MLILIVASWQQSVDGTVALPGKICVQDLRDTWISTAAANQDHFAICLAAPTCIKMELTFF